MTDAPPPPERHSLIEDALAILTGCLLVSLGVVFYAKATLLVGGSSGMALLLQYASGWPFPIVFSVVNLPFYALAAWRMGFGFALRTFAAVSLVSALMKLTQGWVSLSSVDPLYACAIGGVLIGVGMLILFRHRTGLGGVNILAMWLQERLGWRAGWIQLGIDLAILTAALFVLPAQALALSVLGAGIVNLILIVNHKPGRYAGYS
jgi:uncharacterized membrane-anchored protein YitT (DUF2179 family)